MTKLWTIKQFSTLTGVTVRTLQYYDEEDLLKPYHKSDAGYRAYSVDELLCLQKINILKYIGFTLKQIKIILQDKDFDWISSLRLQENILQKNMARIQNGIMLINHSIANYSAHNEVDWQAIAKILKVLQMKHDSKYQDWVNRNFTNSDLEFFGQMANAQNSEEDTNLWQSIFTEAKALMHLSPSGPQVQKLAQKVMASANSQYQGNEGLKGKMWDLMKSGDIPDGFIPGYEKEIVLFLNQAIGILYSDRP